MNRLGGAALLALVVDGGLLWLGLVVALFLLLLPGSPRLGTVFWGVVLAILLLVSTRFRIGPLAIVVMVVAGVAVGFLHHFIS